MKAKRLVSFIMLLVTLSPTALATTLWTGTEPISWGDGKSITLPASAFADMQVADRLTFSFQFTGQTDWPQVSLRNGSWGDLPGESGKIISAAMSEVTFCITSDMLADIQQNGLLITGIGYTLLGVELTSGPGAAGYEHAVWIGEQQLPSDWSGYVALPAACFKQASVGKVLRLHYKDLQVGASALLHNGDWGDMPDGGGKSLSGTYADYAITADMLAELKKGGTIVHGIGYTLTSVDLLGDDDLSKLQLSVPVTHQWLWTAGEQPTIRLNVSNPTAEACDVTATLTVTTDRLEPVLTLTEKAALSAGGSLSHDFEPRGLAPGFYVATVLVNGELARSFVFGIDPAAIVSAPDMQADFASFWQQTKTALAQVAPQYTLTELTNKSTARRKVYLVEMHSLPDATGDGIVRAYYAEPTAEGTYPAIVHYNGYDGGTGTPWCMGGDDNPGYCELIVSTRGQLINNRAPYTNPYGDWFVYGFDAKENYYYRGAYMDAVRAIDFVCSRPKVQQQNIFAEGASQGGALTLAAAALDGRLNAIAPAVPFMGDFPDYFQLASWPANVAQAARQRLGMSEEQMYAMLSYFDTKNLATLITCPVYMNYSLQDNVCPPHINWAAYNNLRSTEKQYLTNPTLGHETAGTWWSEENAFFAAHLKSADGISPVGTQPAVGNPAVYSLQGTRVAASPSAGSLTPGVYVCQGRKIVVR